MTATFRGNLYRTEKPEVKCNIVRRGREQKVIALIPGTAEGTRLCSGFFLNPRSDISRTTNYYTHNGIVLDSKECSAKCQFLGN